MENESTSEVGLDWSDPNAWVMCLSVADRQFDHFSETGDAKYLDAAILNTTAALERLQQSTDTQFDITGYLANLGTMLLTRFEANGHQQDLAVAIQKTREALRLCGTIHASHPQICYMLSMALSNQYEQTGAVSILTESILLGETAVERGDESNYELYGEFLANLSGRLQTRYDLSSAEADLNGAIVLSEKAITITEKPCSGLPDWINGLGNALLSRFELWGREEDIERAIDCSETAIKYGDAFEKQTYGYLSNLSSQLVRSYETSSNAEALQKAIQGAEQAFEAIPKTNVASGPLLLNLATTRRSLFHHSGDMIHLDEAIKLTQEALTILHARHAEHAKTLFSLSNLFMTKFERTGSQEVLDKALEYNQEVMTLNLEENKLWPKILLDASLLHYYNYEWKGDAELLEAALEYIGRAISKANSSNLDFAMMLSTQSMLFLRRFERVGRRADLDEAVRLERKAIDTTPASHPNRPQRLNSLGVAFMTAYKRSGDFGDLEKAIDEFDKAMELESGNNYSLLAFQINKSSTYMLMFNAKKQEDYLNRAVEINQMIDPSSIANHQEQARVMSNIAQTMKEKAKLHQVTGNEMETVTRLSQEALSLSSKSHADRAIMVKNLGDCFMLGESQRYRKQALQCYQEAWESENGLPILRVEAAQAYLSTLQTLLAHDPEDSTLDLEYAAAVSKAAVLLLTSVSNTSLAQQDQQDLLSRAAGLAATACSLCLETNRSADEALDVLETGRGLIISYLLDRKGDLAELKKADARLATRFEQLRNDASASFEAFNDETDFKLRQAMQNRRLRANADLQDLTDEVRKLPEMARFLLGPDATERRELAATSRHVLVVVNITRLRSDGIVVTAKGAQHCPLPTLKYETVIHWIDRHLTDYANMQEFGKKNILCHDFLKWLWSSCVEPIVNTLVEEGFLANETRPPHRICWIGTGIGSQLPFHAAGDHLPRKGNDALTQVISSYTPTFKVLARAVEDVAKHQVASDVDALLNVLMPTTPGEDDLEKVEEEDLEIRKHLEHWVRITTLTHKSAQDIRSRLLDYSMIHFACHGITDVRDPSQSHLKLRCSPSVADPLTVRAISEAAVRRAKLAFLSACSTADNPALRLADEVLHLASGFHVAGFTNVVATMWSTADEVSVQFVSDFYRVLEQHREPGGRLAVAEAVREATMLLRQRKPNRPLLWAQYVHWGL